MFFKLELPASLGVGKVNSAISALAGSWLQAPSNPRLSQLAPVVPKPEKPYFGSVSARRFELVRKSPRHRQNPPYVIGNVVCSGHRVVVRYWVRPHWGVSAMMLMFFGFAAKILVDALVSPGPVVWAPLFFPGLCFVYLAVWFHVVVTERKFFVSLLLAELQCPVRNS